MSAERNCATWLERRGWQVNHEGRWYKRLGGIMRGPMDASQATIVQCERDFYEPLREDRKQPLNPDLDKAEGE